MPKKSPTRAQLRRRANRRANAANATSQAQINAARRQARRTYKTELGASRGAKKANLQMLHQAMGNIPNRIKGLALQQIQADLAGRMQDAKGMVAYEKAGLKQDLRASLSDIRSQQSALDAQIAADAQTELQEAIKRQREKQAAAREKRTNYQREIQSALAEIRNQVAKTRGPGVGSLRLERANLRADPALRRSLQDYLTTSQSISVPAARKAVKMFTRGRNDFLTQLAVGVVGPKSAIVGGRPGPADEIARAIDRLWDDDE